MERTTPVVVVVAVGESKKKGTGFRSIALAAALAVGPMTLSAALGADPAATPAKPAATPAKPAS